MVKIGDGKGFLAADIPGLIEGASEGLGLGHAFLRHVDRCRLLLHVVDLAGVDGRDPSDDLDKINDELLRYSESLAERPQIVVANKADLADMESDSVKAFFAHCEELGYEVKLVSAVTGEGLDELVKTTISALKDLPPVTVYEAEYSPEDEDMEKTSDSRETTVRFDGTKYIVEGEWLFNFMSKINFDDYDQLAHFQRVLIKNGVIEKLEEAGVEEGDTVNIYDFEFDFVY